MKTIFAAISLVVSMGFGALRMWTSAHSADPTIEKVKKIRDELAAILRKFAALAEETPATWDDLVATAASEALTAIADNVIEQLERKAAQSGVDK